MLGDIGGIEPHFMFLLFQADGVTAGSVSSACDFSAATHRTSDFSCLLILYLAEKMDLIKTPRLYNKWVSEPGDKMASRTLV